MHRTPGARLALALSFALLCAAAPAARADGPLGPGAPCTSPQDVVAAMAFEAGFAVAKSCAKLCKNAGATCAKHVNRAVSCKSKSIDDSAYFQIQVTCEGESGQALKTCRQPIEDDRKAAHADLDGERDARLADCDTKAQDCAGQCSGSK